MVAVGELPIVHHHAGGGVCGDVVIAPVHGGRFVDIGEEGFDGFLNGIGAAESTHDTGLFQRVGLLGDAPAHRFGLARGNRPGGGVVPIGVLGEIGVRVQQRAFLGFVEELAVCGGGRPVHQAAGFIGGIVKQVDADLLGCHPGHRRVLLLGDVAGKGDDHAQPGMLRRVFMGGVDAALKVVEQVDLVPDPRLAVVHVQGEHGAAEHHAVLAPAFPELTAHEAAHILDVVLGALLQFAVFLHGFRGTDGGTDLLAQVLPGNIPVLPLLIHAAVAYSDFHTDTSWQFSVK